MKTLILLFLELFSLLTTQYQNYLPIDQICFFKNSEQVLNNLKYDFYKFFSNEKYQVTQSAKSQLVIGIYKQTNIAIKQIPINQGDISSDQIMRSIQIQENLGRNKNNFVQRINRCQIIDYSFYLEFYPFYDTIRNLKKIGKLDEFSFLFRIRKYIEFYQGIKLFHKTKQYIFRNMNIDSLGFNVANFHGKGLVLFNFDDTCKQAQNLTTESNADLLPWSLLDHNAQQKISILDDLWDFVLVIAFIELDESIYDKLHFLCENQDKIICLQQLREYLIEKTKSLLNENQTQEYYNGQQCTQLGFARLYETIIRGLSIGNGRLLSDESLIRSLQEVGYLCISQYLRYKSFKKLGQKIEQYYNSNEWQMPLQGKDKVVDSYSFNVQMKKFMNWSKDPSHYIKFKLNQKFLFQLKKDFGQSKSSNEELSNNLEKETMSNINDQQQIKNNQKLRIEYENEQIQDKLGMTEIIENYDQEEKEKTKLNLF